MWQMENWLGISIRDTGPSGYQEMGSERPHDMVHFKV